MKRIALNNPYAAFPLARSSPSGQLLVATALVLGAAAGGTLLGTSAASAEEARTTVDPGVSSTAVEEPSGDRTDGDEEVGKEVGKDATDNAVGNLELGDDPSMQVNQNL